MRPRDVIDRQRGAALKATPLFARYRNLALFDSESVFQDERWPLFKASCHEPTTFIDALLAWSPASPTILLVHALPAT